MGVIRAKRQLGAKTIKRTFKKQVWDRMGKDKNGWEVDVEFGKPEEITDGGKPEELTGEGSGDQGGSKDEGSKIETLTIPDVIVALKALDTVEAVKDFVEGDERQGVKKASAKRISEIEEK